MSYPLILLHGALGSQQYFAPLLPHLSDFAEVHTLDFEGHGHADRTDRPFRMAHFSENVLDYMNAHGIEKVDIFGYSMGGYVALNIAHLGAKRVNRIFTLATKFEWTPEIAQREIRFLEPSVILEKVPAYAEALQSMHGADWHDVLAKTADMMINLGDFNVLDDEVFAEIQHPVRVGIGDSDKMVSLAETQHVAEQLPAGELQILPDTPHPFEQMSPERVAESIYEFFQA